MVMLEKIDDVIDVENELKETISRKEILEKYYSLDPEIIENPLLREFVQDRNKAKMLLNGYSVELKQYMDSLQKKAAKLHSMITEQNAKMKYIDSKIIEQHIKLEGLS